MFRYFWVSLKSYLWKVGDGEQIVICSNNMKFKSNTKKRGEAMKKVSYLITLICLFILPMFVLADENPPVEDTSAAINLISSLTTGTPEGDVTFKVKEVETGTYMPSASGITVHTSSTSASSALVSNLKVNTSYEVEIVIPDTYEFISLESGTKIITNNQKIIVTTGGTNSTTDVTSICASKGGIASNKSTQDNSDGTSTLSLSVTGKANTTVESNKANILIIYDISGSMIRQNYYVEATPENILAYNMSDYSYDLYGYDEETTQYLKIEQYGSQGKWRFKDSRIDYDGKRYYMYNENINNYTTNNESSLKPTRAAAAEDVTSYFIDKLLAYNTTTSPDNVQLALLTFNGSNRYYNSSNNTLYASIQSGSAMWSLTSTQSNNIKNWFNTGGLKFNGWGREQDIYMNQTNWPDALAAASDIIDRKPDNDPTYVIFITDGAPLTTSTDTITTYRNSLPMIRALKNKATIFGIFTFGRVAPEGTDQEGDYLDDLLYYANTGQERYTTQNELKKIHKDVANHYDARDKDALKDAVDDIFQKIVSTVGFGNVSVSDGTTSQVKVTTAPGQVSSLLEVNPDDTTYNYWLSMPVEQNGTGYKLTRKNKTTGDDETITFTVNGNMIDATWSGESATLEGTISNNVLKYKWKQNTFYDFDRPNQGPPDAVYNTSTGAIDWDLSTLGTLINNVTYTVDVQVWLSQYAQDLIADLRNDPSKYDTLDDGIKDYIVRDGDNFTLRTNTKALVSYTDSNNNPGTTKINNPDPIGAQQKVVTITKNWDPNLLDPDKYPGNITSIELYTVRDGEKSFTTFKVNKISADLWQGNTFLSMGIIKQSYTNGVPTSATIVANGHDQNFMEKDYHWDLTVGNDLHPMLIDNVATMLIKTSDSVTVGSNNILIANGKTYYKINGSVYEVVTGDAASAATVTNTRRSNLNLTKVVVGDDPGGTFKFEVKTTSTEELYFSIAPVDDDKNPIMDDTIVTGASKNIENGSWNGYWITNNTTPGSLLVNAVMTILMKANWNLRFTNVPKGTTFEFTENENLLAGTDYFFQKVTSTNTLSSGSVTSTNPTVSGTVELSNAVYNVEYTNVYAKTNIAVEKVWDGTASHPDSVTFNLYKDDDLDNPFKTAILTSSTTASENWKCTWTGLTKYIDNGDGTVTEVKYTVGEVIPDDGFAVYDPTTNALIGRWKWETNASGDKVVNVTKTEEVNPTNSALKLITNIYSIKNIYNESLKQDLKLRKVSLTSASTTLSGAKFKLYRYNEKTNAWVQIGNEEISAGSGNVTFANLYAGSYRLVETSAPEGYILPKGEWLISITDNGTSLGVSFSGINIPPAVAMADDERYLIPNEELLTLPETGGFGIGNISLIGILVMLMSGIFLLINQRELLRDK